MMKVSCIIATHNREAVYGAIESIIQQTYPAELIVVDDGSSPPVQRKGIRIIRNTSPRGLSVCRNMGMEAGGGDIVAFMDDDARAEKNWIEELVNSFKGGADIAGGLIIPVWKMRRPWWLKDSLLHLIGVNTWVRLSFGCNFAIKKELPERLNYRFEERLGRKYDNLVVGDETEFFRKAKEKGLTHIFNEKAVVYHIVMEYRMKFSYFLKRNFWEGRTESRRHRVKSHSIYYIKWLIRFFLEGLREKDMEKLETVFIQLPLLAAYIYGISFERVAGARDYR